MGFDIKTWKKGDHYHKISRGNIQFYNNTLNSCDIRIFTIFEATIPSDTIGPKRIECKAKEGRCYSVWNLFLYL